MHREPQGLKESKVPPGRKVPKGRKARRVAREAKGRRALPGSAAISW